MRIDVLAALQPYSANELLGLVFAIQSALYFLVARRTGERYFIGLGAGMLLAASAWGTTRWQSPGQAYVDWGWFWAQPLFGGAMVLLALSVLRYLPLTEAERMRMSWWITAPVGLYLVLVPGLMWSGIPVLRLWAVLVQMPAILAPAWAAIRCERREPGMGHLFIGVALLCLPAITVGVAAAGATSLVLRFWTAIPLVVVTLTMLTVSLLRDRRRLESEIDLRSRAEQEVLRANADLERKVQQRTADLHDMVEGLESFNRNVSHDLRGPLGGIDVLAFVAERHLQDGDLEAAKKQVRLISEQVRASNRTVDALLQMARALQQEPECKRVDLDELVKSAAQEATVSVSSMSEGRTLPSIRFQKLGEGWTDGPLLRIALVNLLTNALKFNLDRPETVVSVERLGTSQGPGAEQGSLRLVVKDNGVGFTYQDPSLAFRPFQRMSATSEVPGYGIGLDIVQRIARRLGGRVELEASPGKGTSVTLTLR